jgi:5-methylcytosine-specific restriction protein A
MRIDWDYEEIVLAADLVRRNQWRGLNDGDARVIELSQLLIAARLHPVEHREPQFRNPNGVARKTWDIATQHPDYTGKRTNGNKLDSIVLHAFIANPEEMMARARAIEAAMANGDVPVAEADEDLAHSEGRLLLSAHVRRERSRPLRKRKIQSVKNAGRPLNCEVCEFNFASVYGERGEDYIEVHHVLPLHVSGAVETRISDLALLCANCHRMIHRSPWMPPTQLRQIVLGQTANPDPSGEEVGAHTVAIPRT